MLRNFACDVRFLGFRLNQFYKKMECAERTISNMCYFSHTGNDRYSSNKLQLNSYNKLQSSNAGVAAVKSIPNGNDLHKINYGCEKLENVSSEMCVRITKGSINPHGYFKSTRNSGSVLKPMLFESLQTLISQSGISGTSCVRCMSTGRDRNSFSSIRNRISSLHAKKRAPKKKKKSDVDSEESEETVEGFAPVSRHKFLTYDPDFALPEIQTHSPLHRDWQVTAYATADEYDLDGLLEGLTHQGLYTAAAINPGNVSSEGAFNATSSKTGKSYSEKFSNNIPPKHPSSSPHTSSAVPDAHDVLHMVAAYQIGSENREIYFFREGSVVFWNVAELESFNVRLFLKKYEKGSYKIEDIEEESESFSYTYSDTASKTRLIRNRIVLNPEGSTDLEKYTFSNAMAISVKLGIWEASLEKYIDDIEYVSEELSKTGKVVLSQDQVLQCLGQLCALRHLINLSSDLLDTPDFYWEHEDLELLYKKTSNHLNVSKRTSVMNVKLSHCVELMELLKSHLNEQHSARLEWIIIILIMIEVGFEVLHVAERWL